MLFWPELAQEWHSPPTPREQSQLARQLKAQETRLPPFSPPSLRFSSPHLPPQSPSSPSPNFLPVLFREVWMQMTQESSSSQYALFDTHKKFLLNTNSYKKMSVFTNLKKVIIFTYMFFFEHVKHVRLQQKHHLPKFEDNSFISSS